MVIITCSVKQNHQFKVKSIGDIYKPMCVLLMHICDGRYTPNNQTKLIIQNREKSGFTMKTCVTLAVLKAEI